jgi:hypothetical protein
MNQQVPSSTAGKPWYGSSGGGDCVALSQIFPNGVVGEGSPTARVFRITPEFFECECAVGPSGRLKCQRNDPPQQSKGSLRPTSSDPIAWTWLEMI